MSKNQFVGLVLIAIGLIDLVAVPTIMEKAWRKAKHPPLWADSLNMVIRIIGIIFIFFGISYYFFGQLE